MNPHPSQPSADDEVIEEMASEWFLERLEGFGAGRQQAFAAWLAADARHAEAFERMEQTHALLEKLPFAADRLDEEADEAVETTSLPVASPSRRRWLPAFGAVAAAAAIAVVAWVRWPAEPSVAFPAPAVYATAAGGYERVALADGSTIELNAGTTVEVTVTSTERRLRLVAGEAHFNVARDPSRPFTVAAGDYTVRALGTAFNILLAPAAVEVLVTHGKVEVAEDTPANAPFAAAPDRPHLVAGQRVVIAPGARPASLAIETVDSDALREALAWQERRLVFIDTPLREVAERFNQRNRTQLILGDPSLADKAVGGTFAADNVHAFVRLLESSGDIVSERRGDHEIILHLVR
jgi:transmembrane sensor